MAEKEKRKTLFYHGTHDYYDYSLVFVMLFLLFFGFIMIYSTTAYSDAATYGDALYSVKKQIIISAVALVLMVMISKVDYHIFINLAFYIAVIVFALCVSVLFIGSSGNGSTRWIDLKFFSLQPSELAKPALILALAKYLTEKYKKLGNFKTELIAAAITLLLFIPVVTENLSTALIILGIGFFMTYVASRLKWIFPFMIIAAVAAVVFAWNSGFLQEHILKDYQVERVMAWLNPLESTDDAAYQVLQGLYAVGSGSLFGKGLGSSIQKLGFLPEAQNDMIFAIICEELGLCGAFLVMVLYIILIVRLMFIANNAPDLSGAMLVTGIMIHIGLQVVMNIAVVTNSMPNTGVTLPFISYGGTAVLCLICEMGLALSVSNQIAQEK